MKEKNNFESRSNFLTVYILGLCLFLVCALSGYKIWKRYQVVEEASIAEPAMQSEANASGSLLKAEEELLDASSLHPEFIINEGDTLASLLGEAGIDNNEASAVVNAFSKKYNPRKLNIGTVIELNFEDKNSAHVLSNMVVSINNLKKIEVSRNLNNDFIAKEILTPLVRKVEKRAGVIKNSFINTALGLSIPANAIMGMIRAFSYDVDFQRDIKRGDKLEVVMDKFYTEDGKLSHSGDVLYSSITIAGKKISIYQFTHPDGQVAYYNEKGESIKKEFLRTPINAARISSKFGMRQHPVSGYTKMHRGIDFAAPVGTPILAAGSGVVEVINHHYGNYGKYIRIKHNSSYSTVYAHASRFANIKPGAKVTQGQVIAYVGTTGSSTGPHLHYEVVERGAQINPLKFKFASNSEKLTGKALEQFKQNKKKIERQLAG
jgi:murein DD-endopeptidase MepM/ murein hydrolase activator NlpD